MCAPSVPALAGPLSEASAALCANMDADNPDKEATTTEAMPLLNRSSRNLRFSCSADSHSGAGVAAEARRGDARLGDLERCGELERRGDLRLTSGAAAFVDPSPPLSPAGGCTVPKRSVRRRRRSNSSALSWGSGRGGESWRGEDCRVRRWAPGHLSPIASKNCSSFARFFARSTSTTAPSPPDGSGRFATTGSAAPAPRLPEAAGQSLSCAVIQRQVRLIRASGILRSVGTRCK
mmetsp:Transcript_81257/g.233525  ORF Transcript_81257/g.233525 Transcript_81257/m.233525 type:complete len:235 (+) Transcript_81257:495-1199(+)